MSIEGRSMGKAADRRKIRRQQFLSRLAQENPERFEHEWNKRLESWVDAIWSSKEGKINMPPVFKIVDNAENIFMKCGDKAVELQFGATKDLLENECCQVLAQNIGRNIYKLNQRWETKNELLL